MHNFPAIKWIVPLLCLPSLATADVFLFRGDFIYILPRDISEQLSRHESRPAWRLFPEHTRYIDGNKDGKDDFVAIAVGSNRGYGMQIRYRLRYSQAGKRKLGRWYWCVITDTNGDIVFEKFNRLAGHGAAAPK